MKVPLLDLRAQWRAVRHEIEPAIAAVVESQAFILGPAVEAFERAVANYSTCSHAVGVSSGTDALLLALMSEGIGPGDEVITTPYTFFATAGSVARLGARPVFADIDPRTYNIDVGQVEARITPRTRAVVPVHLYGQMTDMESLMAVAQRRHLVVIEDAAQAIGAEWRGRRAGSIGDYGCFSFFPSKNLGAFGDAGMVVTNDPVRAERMAILRVHGSRPKYYHKSVGGNFRLDALQAAILQVKLAHLDEWTASRQANARRYDALFAEAALGERQGVQVGLPAAGQSRHVFNQYVIRAPRRDELRAHLTKAGVGTEVYYPVPLHLQECFADLGYGVGAFPISETAARETLALPIYPELSDEQARFVVDRIVEFYAAT